MKVDHDLHAITHGLTQYFHQHADMPAPGIPAVKWL